MGDKRIVATAPIGQAAIEVLDKVAPFETSPAPDEETLMKYCSDTIAFVSRGSGAVTAGMIDASPDLKVIGRTGAGYDTVDVDAATRRKIPLVIAPVGGFAVSEGALAMLLCLVKRLPEGDEIVKSDEWNKRYAFTSGDMADKTLGIVGLGRIGQGLAKLVRPFEMTVLAHDTCVSAEAAAAVGAELVGLDELLQRSDYVSLHLPLTPETEGIIDRRRISMMKRGAILVNTCRGGVMESLDVIADALESGQLGAAGLDVYPVEPPDVSHRVFSMANCLCTPHTIGASKLAMNRIFRTMAVGMVEVLEGRRPEHCVNPEVFE